MTSLIIHNFGIFQVAHCWYDVVYIIKKAAQCVWISFVVFRSLKCPQHTDEQRRAVRQHFLGQNSYPVGWVSRLFCLLLANRIFRGMELQKSVDFLKNCHCVILKHKSHLHVMSIITFNWYCIKYHHYVHIQGGPKKSEP